MATFIELPFLDFLNSRQKLMPASNESREGRKGFAVLGAAKLVSQQTRSYNLLLEASGGSSR
jgi:hypothetical protein